MGTSAEKSWKSRVKAYWPYATSSTSILFVACVLFGWFVSWQAGASGWRSYVLAAMDPAVGALGLLAVCLLAPDVFAGKRYRMPHTLSLPTLYLALVYASKALSEFSGSGVRGVEGAGRYDLVWFNPGVILEAWAVLVVIMAMVGALAGEKEGVN